jgi:hypothetical protein
MRFFDVPAMALVAALVGIAACDAGGAAQQASPAAGGSGGTSDAGAGESGASGGANEASDADVDGAELVDAPSNIRESSADCGPIAPPTAWSSWIMPNPKESGLPNPPSYTVSDSGNQITDGVTGLVWQRNVESVTYTWDDARQYCSCLTIDGVDGWRLPSRIELVSIVDWATSAPSIDSSVFPGTPSASFWSASVLSSDPMLGYLVYFENGHTSYSDLGYTYGARCVRAERSPATAPAGRYTIADGTVYDTQTKLTWQQVIPTSLYTWADAKTYCASLSLNGAGWRLPGTGEIQTIVDESTNPSIDGDAFPMTPSEYFWTSSVVVEDPTRAWTAFFTNGSTYSFVMTAEKNVRCVR